MIGKTEGMPSNIMKLREIWVQYVSSLNYLHPGPASLS